MEDEINTLKKRSVVSTLSLFFQSGYTALLGLTANLALTILLSPKVFGIYITVLSLISILNYFSDIGLAASLIQKKEIDKDDIKSVFTVQQLLIVTIILIGFFAGPFIKNFYNLPEEGLFLYWALLLAFFISSLKTIPSIFLERKIQYQKIVLVQIIENTVFYISVIILALMKFNLMSFTYAVLLRSIIGLISIYIISPWLPQIGISINRLRQLLSFGIPFQTSSFLALFKDDLIMLYLSKALGFEGVGYIGWAKKWAEAPIRIIMDNITRVLFPVIARLQHDREKVSKVMNKIIYYQTMLLAPTLLGLGLVMSMIVDIIPKYSKWQPALPIFYLFIISAFLSTYSTPFMNLFNALGKVKITFTFMLIWTVLTWILTPMLTRTLGLFGFPITQLILALTSITAVMIARKIIHIDIVKSIFKPLIATIIMGLGITALISMFTTSIILLIMSVGLGILIYTSMLKVLFKINVINEFKTLLVNE